MAKPPDAVAAPAAPEPLSEKIARAEAAADAWEKKHPDKVLAAPEPEDDAEPAEPEPADEPTAPSEPAEPPETPDAAAAEPAAPAGGDRRALFLELAKEFGYTVSDQKVAVAERAAWREQKRLFREHRDRTIAQINEAQSKIEPILRAREMYEAGDIDEALKLAWGKTLSEINEDAASQAGGMPWGMRQKLRQIEAERTQERARQQQLEQEVAQRRQQEHEQAVLSQIHDQLLKSPDKLVAGLAAEFPSFAVDVRRLQWQEYDREDNTTISVEEAIPRVLANYRSGWERSHKVFGAAAPKNGTPPAGDNVESGVQAAKEPEQRRNGKAPGASAQSARLAAGRKGAPLDAKAIVRKYAAIPTDD